MVLKKEFFQNKINSLISVLLLEGIYFFNYTVNFKFCFFKGIFCL